MTPDFSVGGQRQSDDRWLGGAKSEKPDQAQLRFHLEELEKLAAKGEARFETITYERLKVTWPPLNPLRAVGRTLYNEQIRVFIF